jgi:hypothetical protein
MDTKNATNFLLLIIAACLVLIVIKMYSSVNIIAEAQAQSGGSVYIHGCVPNASGSGCSGWKPILVDAQGRLLRAN